MCVEITPCAHTHTHTLAHTQTMKSVTRIFDTYKVYSPIPNICSETPATIIAMTVTLLWWTEEAT